MFSRKVLSALCLSILVLWVSPLFGQRTRLRDGWNLFTPQQDVEMGRLLAQEAEYSLNFSQDVYAHGYINALGQFVAAHAPGYKYPWEFRIFQERSIQSFALPGGVIYVSSGLVSAAETEPQLAGILAHQIGHVVARHGTQQVSAAYADRMNARRGNASLDVDDVISRLDLRPQPGAVVLKYSLQAEREADTIAAQLLYDARFDPQQITSGFQRLSAQPNNLKMEFFRDHPAPGNRAVAVRRELQRLGPLSANLRGDSPDLHTTQRNLRDEPPSTASDRISRNRPELPAVRFITYQGYDFELQYPENWYADENGYAVTLAPAGGNVSGTVAAGMLIDAFQPKNLDLFGRNSFAVPGPQRSAASLSTATDQLLDELRRSNPNLRVVRTVETRVDGGDALDVEMTNASPRGGLEINRLTTVLRPNGFLYYFLGVAPQADIRQYNAIFNRMTSSIRFY